MLDDIASAIQQNPSKAESKSFVVSMFFSLWLIVATLRAHMQKFTLVKEIL
jgi:hypothetical protein